jgi:FAD:protein FMN transferase
MDEVSLRKPLFGKEVEIVAWGADPGMAANILEEAYHEGLRLQKVFNFYDDSSELSRLNKRRRLQVSQELITVLKTAMKFSTLTAGAYDCSLGRIFLARKQGTKEPVLNCSYQDIAIRERTVTLRHPDVLIDLASIAKGFIADRMIAMMRKEGLVNGLVDARGDISVFGTPQAIGIQHPREQGKLLCSITLKNQAVATSGDYHQYHETFENSHIINATDAISVTVIAKHLMLADAYATALFVVPKGSRKRLLSDPRIQAMVVDKSLRQTYYNAFDRLIQGRS